MKKKLQLFVLMVLSVFSVNAQSWSAVGSGVEGGYITSFCTYNNELYSGGFFTMAGGVPANRIAKWDGTNWSALSSGMNSVVYAICVYNGELYAGGNFTTAGGIPASRIARWNGTNWSAVGTGMINNTVYALCVYNGELYAAGTFWNAGGTASTAGIAKWNGTNWSNLGTGLGIDGSVINGSIHDLFVYNGELYVAGILQSVNSINMEDIVRWNGTSWLDTGPGLFSHNAIMSLAEYHGELYVGRGNSDGVLKWNGTSWVSAGGNFGTTVEKIATYNGELYVGGEFSILGGYPYDGIAKFNGTSWSGVGGGINNIVYSLGVHNGELYAGGIFTMAGGIPANRIAKWNTPVPLPLTLLEFTARHNYHDVILGWKTENEQNIRVYEIERSTDGISYTPAGNINAMNSMGVHQYSFTDINVNALGARDLFYRLKQKDQDGTFSYSRIIKLSTEKSETKLIIYPNPVTKTANLSLTLRKAETINTLLMDNAGKVLQQKQWNLPAGTTSLSFDVNHLARGLYYFAVKGSSTHEVSSFIIR